jgi:glutamine cyclotransferase
MKITNIKLPYIVLLCLLLMTIVRCDEDKKDNHSKPKNIVPVKISSPAHDTQYNLGEVVTINLEVNDPSKINEINLYIEDTLFLSKISLESQTINITTDKSKVGFVDLYLEYIDIDGKPHRDNRRIVFFSDEAPKQLTANIVNTYPHSKTSYTQGLEFYNGKLFESTGQVGTSLIAEVDLLTGNQFRFKNLDAPHFGEGITILNDTIYQITWQSNICFLYDMAFNKIGELTYEGEGWGLCNNGKSIIMTSGDSEIVWRNPHTFEIEKSIYAFNDQTDVTQLNEIELINDKLYINVYTTNNIIEVDTMSGKILSTIDCGAVSIDGRLPGSDVLNGIAYNKETGKTYITGKWWSNLYEVTFDK